MAIQEDRQFPTRETGFFYGYVIVTAAFVIMTLTFGVNYTFGIFFDPLIAEFGWTRALTSGAYAVLTLVAGFWGIFAGRINDRIGPKLVGMFGGFCLGAGFLLMSRVTAIWQMYLIYGLVIAPGIGGSWPILLATVAKWFIARRGLMTGIVAAGIGFGTIITPPLTSWLISVYNWRSAYSIVGAGTMLLIVAASFFLKRDPHQIGQLPYGAKLQSTNVQAREFDIRQVVRTRQFWMVCGIYFCYGYYMHSVMVHIVPYATRMGISPATAASILAIIGGISIIIRFMVGAASDRFGNKVTLLIALVILAVALVWLQATSELWEFILFGVVFGFANGGPMTVQSLLLAELFGLGSLGVIVGGATFIYTIGSAIGPLIVGYIFDLTGSYRPAYIICAVIAVVAIILTLTITPVKNDKEVSITDISS